ncbi:MAG: S1C family serine protease [Bacteroidota bacterium]
MDQDGISRISNWVGHWHGEDETGEELGSGSCWPIADDLVVTNYHVMTIGVKATVTINNYGRFPVLGIVAMDKPRDLAIAKLRMGNKHLSPLHLSDKLPRQGTDIYVFGNPQGLQNTVTRGIIGAVRKTEELSHFGYVSGRRGDLLLQLDAAINPGSSGGPIVDRRGAVVGVTALSILHAQGLNFAVPCQYVAELLDMAEAVTPLKAVVPPSAGTVHGRPTEVAAAPAQRTLTQAEISMWSMLSHLTLLTCATWHQTSTSEATRVVYNDEINWLIEARGWNPEVIEKGLEAARAAVDKQGVLPAAEGALLFLREHIGIQERQNVALALARVVTADGQVDGAEADLWQTVLRVWDDMPWPED